MDVVIVYETVAAVPATVDEDGKAVTYEPANWEGLNPGGSAEDSGNPGSEGSGSSDETGGQG